MNKVDLFFSRPFRTSEIGWMRIYDKGFSPNSEEYSNFAGINVPRIKLIPLLMRLRASGAVVWSVPTSYRDQPNLSLNSALMIATKCAKDHNLKILEGNNPSQDLAPLFWQFSTSDIAREKSDGCIIVDRIDGHIWSLEELDEYLYDYNCIY